jgi:phospholipid/cholesterol/gamma-HCH transport system ATP-binding protein
MDTPREPLIEFKGVSKTFGDRNILNRIDLSVYEGEVTTLIGLSGTGRKSAMKKYSKETVVGIFVVIG